MHSDAARWHLRRDATRFWGSNAVSPLYDKAGQLLGYSRLVRDITLSYDAASKLRDDEQHVRLLLESVHDYAIFAVTLDGTVTSWSAGAQQVFGFSHVQMLGRNIAALYPADAVSRGEATTSLRLATDIGCVTEERWLVRKDGSRFLASCKLQQLKRGAGGELRGFVMIAHDITANDAANRKLIYEAHYDELTDLPNRRLFYERVQAAISSIQRRSSDLFAVLFIDLDNFKHVNDEYGHVFADQLLALTARRLEKCTRSEDIVARIGGDEFAVLLNNIGGVHEAADAADRILAQMRQPIRFVMRDVRITVSVGIAMGNPRYEIPQDVLRDADTAMYAAKASGRARATVFESSMLPAAPSPDVAAELRVAIRCDELCLAYQPIIRIADSTTVGFEALVRWQNPRRGLLLPGEFILIAEQRELIVALDAWVLAHACGQLAQWRAHGSAGPTLQISVNVSSQEFSRIEFPAELRRILTSNFLPPHCLRLKITESTRMERSQRTTGILAAIRALGIHVHADDFGTGYSSLSALQHYHVDALKIDATLVAALTFSHGVELVEAVITLAHNLGLSAIAEGIETPEQFNALVALKCDFGQGNLFAAPLAASLAQRYLTKLSAAAS